MTDAEIASGTTDPTVCANRLIRSGDERGEDASASWAIAGFYRNNE